MSTIVDNTGDTTGAGAAFNPADVAITGGTITGLPTPSAASDAVNKAYADGLINGLKWKASVVVATTVAGTLATSFAAGQTVDGVTLTTGMRILIKNQVTGSQNGIYTVNASGAPTRTVDADVGTELVAATVPVERGTANADKIFVCTNDAITIGVTSIVFTALPSVVGALLASNNLSDITSASSARTSLGLGSAALENANTFSQLYVGPDLDCFSPNAVSAVVPALGAGKVFSFTSLVFIVVSRSGTITGSPVFKIGSNGAHDNLSPTVTAPSAASLSASTPGLRGNLSPAATATSFFGIPDLATPVTLELTTPAVGSGAALVIRPVFVGVILTYP